MACRKNVPRSFQNVTLVSWEYRSLSAAFASSSQELPTVVIIVPSGDALSVPRVELKIAPGKRKRNSTTTRIQKAAGAPTTPASVNQIFWAANFAALPAAFPASLPAFFRPSQPISRLFYCLLCKRCSFSSSIIFHRLICFAWPVKLHVLFPPFSSLISSLPFK